MTKRLLDWFPAVAMLVMGSVACVDENLCERPCPCLPGWVCVDGLCQRADGLACSAGGTTSTGGGAAGGVTSGGAAGGDGAGGSAGGSLAGGSAGGALAGGSAGGSLAGGSAGGSLAGGSAGGSLAGGSAGGSAAGGTAGGVVGGGSTSGGASGGRTCTLPSECDDGDVCTVDSCQGTCSNTRLHDSATSSVAPFFGPPISLTFPTNARAPVRLVSDGEQVVVFLDGTTSARRVFPDGGTATFTLPATGGFLSWNGSHFLYVWNVGPDGLSRYSIQARAYDQAFATLGDGELGAALSSPATGMTVLGSDFVVLTKTDRRYVSRSTDGGLGTRLAPGFGGSGLAATPDQGLLIWDAVPGTATKTFVDADGGSFVEYPHLDGGTQQFEYAHFVVGPSSAMMFFDLNIQGPIYSSGHYLRPIGADHRFSAGHRVLGVSGNRQSSTEHVAFDGANFLVALESQNRFSLLKVNPQGTVFADDAGLGSGIEIVAVRSIIPGRSALAMKRDAGVVVRTVITCP